MSSEQDQAAPAVERAIEFLERESLSTTERIERVESLLDQREEDVDDALARFAAGSERHVLTSDQSEYESFLDLCRAAERNGHAVEVTAVVRQSLHDGADPGTLKWEIQSIGTLTDEQVAERLSLLTEAVADDELPLEEGTEAPNHDVEGPTTEAPDGDEEPVVDQATEDAETTSETDRSSFPAGVSAPGTAERRSSSVGDPGGRDEEFETAAPHPAGEESNGSDSTEVGGKSEPADSVGVRGEGGTVDSGDVDGETGAVDSGEAETTAVEEADQESVAGTESEGEAGATDSAPDDVDMAENFDGGDSPAEDGRHREPLRPPQRSDPTEQGAFSMPNYAQDLVQFDFVLDSDDRFVPNDVRGSGMVVVGEKQYVGIVRVKPRSWSIHTNEKKGQIIDGYKSSFLATLDFPVQIVSYPTKFDISDHVQRLSDVVEEGHTRSTDSKLVNVGRELYPNWLERFIQDNDMKQRQLYIVVPLSAHQINDFADTNEGFLDQIGEKLPPLKPLADFLSDDDGIDVTEQQCLRELDSRLTHVGSGLRRFDVEVERLADRTEVMSVLYHYYNNEQPLNDAFPTGPYSTVEAETGMRR